MGVASLIGLCAGLVLGLRLAARDAALLAVLDKRVAVALEKSAASMARAAQLEEAWADYLDQLERKRASARSERQRAEKTREQAEAATKKADEQPAEQPLEGLPLAEQRLVIARRLRGA
jgi:predicted  nucleic acid-binding Zn-ribbon protein